MTKADFFISYTGRDKNWAEWIAWILEENSYSVKIQEWDCQAGMNFPDFMDTAIKDCDKTIAILSDAYMKSGFTKAEWYAAFKKDPTGKKRLLIPVRIENCQVNGLLSQVVCVDIFKFDEQKATEIILSKINDKRNKPMTRPLYPGKNKSRHKPVFPGESLEIELIVDRDFDTYSEEEQNKLLNAIKNLLDIGGNLSIKQKRRGSYKYDVALSFAGEDRETARALAIFLRKKSIVVFYDENERRELYRDSARFCLVLSSRFYTQSKWTLHELQQAQARAFREDREYILPVKLDDTELPGLTDTVSYLDSREISIEKIVFMVLQKLQVYHRKHR